MCVAQPRVSVVCSFVLVAGQTYTTLFGPLPVACMYACCCTTPLQLQLVNRSVAWCLCSCIFAAEAVSQQQLTGNSIHPSIQQPVLCCRK